MKKFLTSLCVSAFLIAGQVEAQDYATVPYIVGTFKHHTMKHQKGYGLEKFKESIPGVELCLGTKVYPGIEIEAGTHITGWGKNTFNKSKIVSTFARVIGGIEFHESGEFLIGMGLSMTNFDYMPVGDSASTTIRKAVPHALVGLKIKFADSLFLRPMFSVEGTKNNSHPTIRQGHSHAFHLGLVSYF
jgi:hypothetical protein